MFARRKKRRTNDIFGRGFRALFVMPSPPGAFAGGRRFTMFHISFGETYISDRGMFVLRSFKMELFTSGSGTRIVLNWAVIVSANSSAFDFSS